MFQRIIQGCKELRAQILFAHLQGGLGADSAEEAEICSFFF
jgi:hypothetical protein